MRRARNWGAVNIPDTSTVECMDRVRRQVDVGAEAQELESLFEDDRSVAELAQSDRRR